MYNFYASLSLPNLVCFPIFFHRYRHTHTKGSMVGGNDINPLPKPGSLITPTPLGSFRTISLQLLLSEFLPFYFLIIDFPKLVDIFLVILIVVDIFVVDLYASYILFAHEYHIHTMANLSEFFLVFHVSIVLQHSCVCWLDYSILHSV